MTVKFVITAPGYEGPVFSAEVTREQIDATKIPEDPEVDDPLIIMNLTAAFRPFLLKAPGRIKVRAYRGEDEIRLGTLRVQLFPAKTPASSEPTEPSPKSKEAAN